MARSTEVVFILNVEDMGGRFLDCRTFLVMPAKGDHLTDQNGNTLLVEAIDHGSEGQSPTVIAKIVRRAGSRGGLHRESIA